MAPPLIKSNHFKRRFIFSSKIIMLGILFGSYMWVGSFEEAGGGKTCSLILFLPSGSSPLSLLHFVLILVQFTRSSYHSSGHCYHAKWVGGRPGWGSKGGSVHFVIEIICENAIIKEKTRFFDFLNSKIILFHRIILIFSLLWG